MIQKLVELEHGLLELIFALLERLDFCGVRVLEFPDLFHLLVYSLELELNLVLFSEKVLLLFAQCRERFLLFFRLLVKTHNVLIECVAVAQLVLPAEIQEFFLVCNKLFL